MYKSTIKVTVCYLASYSESEIQIAHLYRKVTNKTVFVFLQKYNPHLWKYTFTYVYVCV